MPGPVIQKPTLPGWMDPAQASVFDVPGQGLLRKVVGLLGLDDPNQVMGVAGTPLETGANTGGLVDALAQRFPRFAQAIKAYHGSPHDFEQFDTSKIGTGEGAQAYGHGLYFAENPQVAADYRRTLAAPTADSPAFRLAGEPVALGTDRWRLAQLLETPKTGETPAQMVTRRIGELENQAQFAAKSYGDDAATMYRLQVSELRKIDPSQLTFHQPGRTYEVAIKAHPDQFLDWDKPLSQQNEAVHYMMGYKPPPTPDEVNAMWTLAKQRGVPPASMPEYQALEKQADAATQFDRDYPNGRAIYNQIMNDQRDVAIRQGRDAETTLPHAQAAASQQLKEFGIPGIKYLDQGSRAAGEGSRNFVVFDDKTVEILKKYGLLLPASGAALAGQQKEQQ
jgi:hypothetical protein